MSDPTRFINDTTLAARKVDVPGADFDGGLNQGGACAPGLGINEGVTNTAGTDEQFTLLDQVNAARAPQVSQHLGGDGLGSGVSGAGTDGIGVVTNSVTGDGTVTETGQATLATLAAGWTAVV